MADAGTPPELMEERDAIDLLIRQHERIRDLFDEVEVASGTDRKDAFERLARLLAVHETAEEEILHPYARRTIEGGAEVIDDRLEEEREAKEVLSHLEQIGPDHPEFMVELLALRASVLAHANAEEQFEFAALRRTVNADTLRGMATALKAAEAMAPTHPHPGVETGTENVLIGPVAAIMDRTRDVIRRTLLSG